MEKVILIGSGNVATHLGRALFHNGIKILQVWSQSIEHARVLAKQLESEALSDLSRISAEADAYFFLVKDDALGDVLTGFPHQEKLLFHTAGSISATVFKPYSSAYGVLYPLQTFSKEKDVNFREIPLLLEASDDGVMNSLRTMAEGLSSKVSLASSEQRKFLHIAAVFACNFTNHLYAIAEKLLIENGLDFNLIRPLILETAQKAMLHSPQMVQTGPATRKDEKIIDLHTAMLNNNPELQDLYQLLSEQIMNKS